MLRGYGLPVMASNAVADQASMMIPLLGLAAPDATITTMKGWRRV